MATPNPVTSHFTSTKNQTIHFALSITFRNPSTNGCPKSRSMNVRLTKRHLSIRKPWMTADTITASYSHRTHYSLRPPPERTAAGKSSGTTHPLARTWLQTLDERSLRSWTKSSRKVTCSTKFSTAARSRSSTVACLTSNRRLTVTTNPPYRKCQHHQLRKHATAEDQLTAL